MPYAYLFAAILAEVVATSALKAADGFRNPGPSVLVVVGYAAAFWFLSLTLKAIPLGVAYAIWSGVGIVIVTAAAWVLYQQKLDAPALAGMALIVAGVVVMQLFSKTVGR